MTSITVPERRIGRPGRRTVFLGLAVTVVVVYLALHGRQVLPHDEEAGAFGVFNDVRSWVDDNRDTSVVFTYFVNYIRLGVALVIGAVQSTLAALGWMGVVAVAGAIAAAFAGWRTAALTVAGFLFFGLIGLWTESIDTLALTVSAVLIAMMIGIPAGIAAGRVPAVRAVLTPVLDVMQIMPTFAYLAPMTLLFLIGEPSAIIATLIFALPAAIRITALGIREVPGTMVEAATSMGSTRWQVLRKVQLPAAKRALILATNQTIMLALSMVVVTALIDAPGLGQTIVRALERVNVGVAFDAGVAIVVMAIVLDRITTNAARRAETQRPGSATRRRLTLLGVAVTAAAVTVIGRLVPAGAEFPDRFTISFADPVNGVVGWIETNLYPITDAVRNGLTAVLLNPLQDLLTGSPWWLTVAAVVLLGLYVSGVRAALIAGGALVGIAALGLWQHSMETLTTVLVATILTLLLGVLLGVLAAGNDRFAAALRPMLDAAQTMPSFVYLLPAVALFGASRFTAIAAAMVFATPPVIRLVETGLREVPTEVVEAAVSAGSTPGQVLWKVKLPLARGSMLLAANQGIIQVLAMVVVGGLVGAGALGFDVVAGFSQREDFGKGLAAGFCIVLLGIMLDRLTQGAGQRRERDRVKLTAG